MSALGDNSLKAIQECRIAKPAWDIFQCKYASKNLINKLGVLNNLLKMKLISSEDVGDLIEMMVISLHIGRHRGQYQ